MKLDTISLRRRHLIIAGLAGVAAPAAVFAAPSSGAWRSAPAVTEILANGSATEESLVVSGRILGPGCKPLADATVAAWRVGESRPRASATTDADGRFMFTTTAQAEHDGRPQPVSYRVSHQGHAVVEGWLDFARTADIGRGPGVQLQRDEAGVWRAAAGLTLA